jgi:hypothetical protein
VHRESGKLLTLAEWLGDPEAALRPAELTTEQQIALVRARWLAGEWQDIVYGTEGSIDRDRAIKELESQSDTGRHLMAIGLRAIEMAHESTRQAGDR